MANNLIYNGWKKWVPTLEEWAKFSVEPYAPFEMKENEYLLIYAEEDNVEKLVGQYYYSNGKLKKFGRSSISWSFSELKEADQNPDKKIKTSNKAFKKIITPRNPEQVAAFNLMQNRDITCKLLTGKFGSGKTLIATAAALEMLMRKEVEKIVWLRNTVGVKDVGSLGFMPGDLIEKIKPWIGPLIDNAGSELAILHMIERGQLETPALESIRGRTFDNAVVICTEAQNLTEDLVKLIIGRIGENSIVIFDGDFKQTDKVSFDKSPGIKAMIRALAGNRLFGYVNLPTIERSKTARLADEFDKLELKDQIDC